VCCFEFKLNSAAEEALIRIDNRELIKARVSFDHEERNNAVHAT
jgi:hypothetical protein